MLDVWLVRDKIKISADILMVCIEKEFIAGVDWARGSSRDVLWAWGNLRREERGEQHGVLSVQVQIESSNMSAAVQSGLCLSLGRSCVAKCWQRRRVRRGGMDMYTMKYLNNQKVQVQSLCPFDNWLNHHNRPLGARLKWWLMISSVQLNWTII